MASATVTSKGQITIPVSIREALGIKAGQVLEFTKMSNGRFEIFAKNKSASALKGIVKTTRTVSIEEMNEAIALAATQSGMKGLNSVLDGED